MSAPPNNDYEVFYGFPYRSYEEIQLAKLRRLRQRRRLCFLVFVLTVTAAVYFILGPFSGGEGALGPNFNPVGRGDSTGGSSVPAQTGQGSGTDGDFSLPISTPGETGMVVVNDVSAIVEKVKRSVVGILTESYASFTQSYSGSGIILSEKGYIITNNHVIEGGDSITVVLSDEESYPAYLIGADKQTDIAILKIEAESLSPAEFGDSDKVKVGQAAIVIGSPGGLALQGSTTMGIISGINRNLTVNRSMMSLIQTDASINPGNSGGPLINQYGQVVGLTSLKISANDYEGIGFAIPINTVRPVAEELIAKGYVSGRPLAGLSVRLVSQMAASFYGLPRGLIVDEVEPSSDAAAAGIVAGDILVYINDERIYSLDDAITLRNAFKAGDTIKISVYRNHKIEAFEVKLLEQALLGETYNF